MHSYNDLPENLPVPPDDGCADHLPGLALPKIALVSTASTVVDPSTLPGRIVVYVYPMTRRPGVAQPDGWDSIPGARGCTPESCGFRDHFRDLLDAGASSVFGLSSQSTDEQAEAARRLHLPFPLLSDPEFEFSERLELPTFTAGGRRFHTRLTLIVREGAIEHAFYPIFPPDTHAAQVVAWLTMNRA